MKISGLYLVTNNDLLAQNSELSLHEGIEEAISGGVRVIQLREPILSAQEVYEIAKSGVRLARENKVTFLINDRVDIMLATDADGVHLGWRSLSVGVTRELIGNKKIIGVSTHSVRESLKAQDAGADYVTIGPIYPTPSKYGILDPLGVDVLKEAVSSLEIPVVAIGGIQPEHIAEVAATGVSSLAIMSGIMGAADIRSAVEDYARRFMVQQSSGKQQVREVGK